MLSKKEQLSKNKVKDVNLLDKTITVRLAKQDIKNRVKWLLNKEVCQVCEENSNLDYPHHAVFGWSRKDDRTMINICIDCHKIIHTKGYKLLKKSKEEIEDIGWNNNKEYLKDNF